MPKLLQAVACALLCCALRGASAATYGQTGVGSQYQLFGGPISDTGAQRISPLRSGADATVFAVTGDSPGAGEAKAEPQTHACDSGFLYSDVFNKCLPAPGKDGYIGKAYDEQGKGKGATDSSAFMPIGAQSYAPMAQPMLQPLRAAALTGATDERPQSPQQPLPPGGSPRARAPVRQLRLACPSGFAFNPVMGACIAPAAALQQQAMHMRMNRPRDDEDNDDDDDSDELRRGRMFGRHLRRRMFGRRFGFGGPRILAPVFVFVLPPLDRNATRFGLRFGDRTQRIHEVHPSMIGPIGGTTAAAAPRAPEAPEKPIAPEKPKAIESEPKPTPGPKGTGTDTPTEAGALRGAFVNPIVSSGKTLPLKAQSAIESEPIRGVDDNAWRTDINAADPMRMRLRKHHAFVSPLIPSHADAA